MNLYKILVFIGILVYFLIIGIWAIKAEVDIYG